MTLAWAFAAGETSAAPSRESMERSILRTMEVFGVPGMAVAVVHGGEVVYAGGHGVVEIGSSVSVDDRTLFQIGSVSKAFTAAALALLADDGKLAWDDKVIDHLPEFRMYDPWVTREFTIRDLLTHRSGLPLGAGDLLMFPDGKTSPEEVVHALRYLEPSSSFRSRFAYDNLLYIVAGEIAERAAGQPFAELVEQRLLAPLGMDDCAATLDRVRVEATTATPHLIIDGKLETTTSRVTGLVAAAGGINCSARSMARWMSFVLERGRTAAGGPLISAEQFEEMVRPVTVAPAQSYLIEHSGAHLNAYALGWGISTFYGQPIWSHGGGVWGMTTFVAVLPERNLAVFASNNLMSAAPRAVVNDLLDLYLADVEPEAGRDWIAIVSEVSQSRQAEAAEVVAQAMAARDTGSEPSLPLEAYTGTYRDPWYGDVHITMADDGRLWFRSPRNEALQGPLEHFQYDTFIARWTDHQLDADAYVSFTLGPEGDVERVRMKAVSPATDFSYDFHDLDLVRQPPP
jgi:CubicO group peptidase (beta-lactamase class C family)